MKNAIFITTLLATLPMRAEVTFTKDVAPIIFNHCAGCHRPGEAAPFALLNYNAATHVPGARHQGSL